MNVRTIHFLTLAECLMFGSHFLLAQSDASRWPEIHKSDLSEWAAKTGKSLRYLDQLTKTATSDNSENAAEEDSPYTIENIDTHTLAQRHHILLSTWMAGTGHCLTVYVLKRQDSHFEKVWQSYDNFCTRSILGPAKARATSDGRIVVNYREYAVDSDATKDASPILRVTVTYKWDGSAYVNAGRTERPEPSINAR